MYAIVRNFDNGFDTLFQGTFDECNYEIDKLFQVNPNDDIEIIEVPE